VNSNSCPALQIGPRPSFYPNHTTHTTALGLQWHWTPISAIFMGASGKFLFATHIAGSDSICTHSSCSQKHTAVAVNCSPLVRRTNLVKTKRQNKSMNFWVRPQHFRKLPGNVREGRGEGGWVRMKFELFMLQFKTPTTDIMHPDCDLAFALPSFACTMLERTSFHCFTWCIAGRMAVVAKVKEFSKILCKFHLPHSTVKRHHCGAQQCIFTVKWQHCGVWFKTKTPWVLL